MSILPKGIYKFNVMPTETPKIFFTETENSPKIHMEPQKTPNSQNNLEKEEQARCITLLDFKLYYEAIVIKTVWYWHKNSHIEQNREPRGID